MEATRPLNSRQLIIELERSPGGPLLVFSAGAASRGIGRRGGRAAIGELTVTRFFYCGSCKRLKGDDLSAKRIISPLLSAFVLPGVGQLVNRQAGKGALFICVMSLILMGGLFLAAYEVTVAAGAIGDTVQQKDMIPALAAQLGKQGLLGLKLLAGAAFVVWVSAIVDAARWGARRDREALAEKEKDSTTPADSGNQSSDA